jgi:hypothetical protein
MGGASSRKATVRIGSSFRGWRSLGGQPLKDLNDVLGISGGSYRGNAKGIDDVMRF